MTYATGNVILATDYNGFANDSSNNVATIWATGSSDKGWGQTSNVANVSIAGTVTATQWANLVNTLTAMGSQTNTTLTSRTPPVVGNTISVLANVANDINSITNNRGNAAAIGTLSTTWTGNVAKTSTTGSGSSAWTITWTQTVTFASAAQARYFWNAGGLVRLDYSKSSTGTDHDPDWNTLAGQVGQIYISGRVNSNSQLIAGTTYTGTTRTNGTGGTQTTLATTTGWYSLTPGAAATTIFQLNNASSPYTPEYIRTTAAINASSTVLTLVTTWVDDGTSAPGTTSNISGGTSTASPFVSFGTAPCTLLRYYPPSTTYLANTWGTISVASSVA